MGLVFHWAKLYFLVMVRLAVFVTIIEAASKVEDDKTWLQFVLNHTRFA